MYTFNKEKLKTQLEQLPFDAQLIFGLACAQRQMASYNKFHHETGLGNYDEISILISEYWDRVIEGKIHSITTDKQLERCMELIPNSEEVNSTMTPYAEDAGASLAYVIRAMVSGDNENLIWAAMRGYEAVDHYVVNEINADYNKPGIEEEILAHPLVQTELNRQERDLNELVGLQADKSPTKQAYKRIQARACNESSLPSMEVA